MLSKVTLKASSQTIGNFILHKTVIIVQLIKRASLKPFISANLLGRYSKAPCCYASPCLITFPWLQGNKELAMNIRAPSDTRFFLNENWIRLGDGVRNFLIYNTVGLEWGIKAHFKCYVRKMFYFHREKKIYILILMTICVINIVAAHTINSHKLNNGNYWVRVLILWNEWIMTESNSQLT